MSYLIYTDSISSLLDPKLVDPGSTLVHTIRKPLAYNNIQKRLNLALR